MRLLYLRSYCSLPAHQAVVSVQEKLPGRDFSFWKWFWANMNLVRNYVCKEWQQGYIMPAFSLLPSSLHCLYFVILDLNGARDDGDGSGVSWTICKQSAPRCTQITTPTPHLSIFTGQMLFLTVSK